MTRRITSEGLAEEAARRRRELRAEESRHAATRAVLDEANRMLIGVYLRERLEDPRDFELLVGVAKVLDEQGRIRWELLDALVDELLSARPRLAATREAFPGREGTGALNWLTQQTV